ncbi:MAG: hypothetical protein ACYCPQ_10180 [Elusimicrobiota bacterium]
MSQSAIFAGIFYIIGMGAAIEDWKKSQVSNEWILVGVSGAILGYLILAIRTFLGIFAAKAHRPALYFFPGFYRDSAIHIFLAGSAAIAFWHWRIWPAGDAKLYFVLSLFLALIKTHLWGFPEFLFLTTLINIFVAAGMFVGGLLLWEWTCLGALSIHGLSFKGAHALWDRTCKRLRDEWAKRANYALAGWNTAVVFFLARLILGVLGAQVGIFKSPLAAYFLMYIFWGYLGPFFIHKKVAEVSFLLFVLTAIPTLFVSPVALRSMAAASIKAAAGFGIFFPIMRRFVDYYLVETRLVPMPVERLKPGMILAKKSWERILALRDLDDGPVPYADGISREDVSWICRRFTSGFPESPPFFICRHRPFASWIFLGCLWTLYERGNLALWILSAIHRH